MKEESMKLENLLQVPEFKDLKNLIILACIKYWIDLYPNSLKTFKHKGISFLIQVVDTASTVRKISKKEIFDFISGCRLIPFAVSKPDKYEDMVDELMNPAMDIIRDYFQHEYLDFLIKSAVPGDEILNVDGSTIPITADKIRRDIQMSGKYPVTYSEIDAIVSDFIGRKKDTFRGIGISTANNQSPFRIAEGKKTDFAKIISAMYDCRLFETEDCKIASNKQDLFNVFGRIFDADFSAYSTLLSSAKNTSDYCGIFDKLKEKGKKYEEKQVKR